MFKITREIQKEQTIIENALEQLSLSERPLKKKKKDRTKEERIQRIIRRALRKVARFNFLTKSSTFAFVLTKTITFRFSLRKLARLSGLPRKIACFRLLLRKLAR